MDKSRPSTATDYELTSRPALSEKNIHFSQENVHAEPPQEDHLDTDSTSTNSSDEFDWDEDDAQSEHQRQPTRAKRGRAAYMAFMRLSRPVRVILLFLLGSGIMITPLLVAELRFKSSVVRPHVFAWSLWFSVSWFAACVTYVIVGLVPRLVIWAVVMFGGHVERLKMQIELIAAVSAWLALALDISWIWIILAIIRHAYHPPGNYWVNINRVMQALFSAGIICLVEKVFLHFVAINFHQKALAERLAENRLGLEALDRLSNAHPPTKRHGKKGHTQGFSNSESRGHSQSNLSPNYVGSEKSGATLNVRKYAQAERKRKRKSIMATVIVDQVGGAIGHMALKASNFHKQGDLGSLASARKLAQKLFLTLSDVYPRRSHLIVEDFLPYFRSNADAHTAFAIFDKDGNGDISRKEMREAVQRIYKERKALILSVKDIDSAVAKLDAVLLAIALLALIFICLLIFNPQNTIASLVPLATLILGFSFIFGHSAQVLFESLIFIFSTHVFDVGDLIMIDDQVLEVREFGLFSTTFQRVDGQAIVAPNALLASAKIVHNLRRSSSTWETTTIMVSYDTSLDIIEQLRVRIGQYINENNREWSGFNLNIDKMEFQNAIYLIIGMEHRRNWQDWGGRWARRTEFMRNLKTILEDLDLKYMKPVQPVLLPRHSPFFPENTIRLHSPDLPGPMFGDDPGSDAAAFRGAEHLFRLPSSQHRSYGLGP